MPQRRIKELEGLDIEARNPNSAGVMALFYPSESQLTRMVLILRKTYKGVHSNQIGFPGGKLESSDRDLEHTALRETEEEVGIPQNEIQVIKALTRLYIPPSNFWVHPYMGFMEKTPLMVAQEDEVEKIIEVELADFLDENCLVKERLSTRYASNILVPAFKLKGHIVWGATAMMLSEIREMMCKSY